MTATDPEQIAGQTQARKSWKDTLLARRPGFLGRIAPMGRTGIVPVLP